MRQRALPRQLHPFSWWTYGVTLAAAASMTTNPLLLSGIITVACVVTFSRRGTSPWAKSFPMYLWLAAFMVVLRVGLRIVFGGGGGATILFTLPEVPLPSWVTGIQLLGPVSLESLLFGFYDGLRLATIVVCIGAANALANPRKVLASVPGALYEVGTVIVVAVSALPQLGESLQRVLRARSLRRHRQRGGRRQKIRAIETIIIPVLSDALERSLSLAASMDVRGFGRSGITTPQARRRSLVLGLLAMMLLGAWSFRFLARSTDFMVAGIPVLSGVLLLGGVAAAAAAMKISGASVRRTQYRPIRWTRDETTVVASSAALVAVLMWVGEHGDVMLLNPSIIPLAWPTLTPLFIAALGVAVLPALVTPRPLTVRRAA